MLNSKGQDISALFFMLSVNIPTLFIATSFLQTQHQRLNFSLKPSFCPHQQQTRKKKLNPVTIH